MAKLTMTFRYQVEAKISEDYREMVSIIKPVRDASSLQ